MSNFCLNCEKFTNIELVNGLCDSCNIINYLKKLKLERKIDNVDIKRACQYCNKTVVSIGSSRVNGNINVSDWKSRNCHIKCYKLNRIEKDNFKIDLRI